MFSVFAFFSLASFIPQPQPASAVWRMPKECSSSHSSWSSWGVQTHSKIDHFPHFLKLYEWVYDDKVSFLFTVRRYLSLGQSSDKCHLKEKSSLKVEKGKCNHPRVIEFTRGNILKLLHFFFFFEDKEYGMRLKCRYGTKGHWLHQNKCNCIHDSSSKRNVFKIKLKSKTRYSIWHQHSSDIKSVE